MNVSSAEDVGIFLGAKQWIVFDDGEQEIYSSIYVYTIRIFISNKT